MLRRTRTGMVVLVVLLWPGAVARAQLVINSFADDVDANPGDNVCETAPGNGICTLRAAIMEVNALPLPPAGFFDLVLPPGLYGIAIGGGGENFCVAGDLDVRTNIRLSGQGGGTATIDGGGLDRVFDVHNNGSLTLVDIVVRGGDPGIGSPPGTTSQHGGGIRVNSGGLVLEDCVVENNVAQLAGPTASDGGGIYSVGPVTLSGTTVRNNTADGSGGGVHVANDLGLDTVLIEGNAADAQGGGLFASNGSVTGLQVTLRSNTAGASGGGARIASTATLDLVDAVLELNQTTGVGGAGGLENAGTATLDLVRIEGNTTAGNGGGVSNNGATASAVLTDCTVRGNTANGALGGGGLMNTRQLELRRTTVSANTVFGSAGGGVYSWNTGATLTAVNCTISNNTSFGGEGGGLRNGLNATAELSNVTFAVNQAASGDNIHNGGGGPVVCRNSILAAVAIGNGCAGGPVASAGFNIDTDGTCAFAGPGDQSGTILAPLNPLLGPLQNNGGPTDTHALLPGSPAIDAGDPAGCTDHGGLLISTDQRGQPRPEDGDADGIAICDVGAYERTAPAPPNDDCTSAITVSEGVFAGTNVNATTDGIDEPALCTSVGDTNVQSDVWYEYVASCNGVALVSLCGSSFDTKLAVYDLPCGAVTGPGLQDLAIACNDDACGLQSEVVIPTVAGATSLLRIGGYLGAQGAITLSITCTNTCPEDLDGNTIVGFADLNLLLAAWGPCPGCPEDLDGNGAVGFVDLNLLLAAWGPCP